MRYWWNDLSTECLRLRRLLRLCFGVSLLPRASGETNER